jgi:hypothetical protein
MKLDFTYPLRCHRVPQVEYHGSIVQPCEFFVCWYKELHKHADSSDSWPMLLKKHLHSSSVYRYIILVVKVTESSVTVVRVRNQAVIQKLEGSTPKPTVWIRTRQQLNIKNEMCHTADLIL